VADTIPSRLVDQARRRPGSPALYSKVDGEYRPIGWADYAGEVRRAGKALIAHGFEPGGHVAILGFNRAEWMILDLACMSVGGAPAGIYATSSAEEVRFIADHAEVPVILVENKAQLEKVLAVRDDLPHLRLVVTMRGVDDIADPGVIAWDAFLGSGDGVDDAEFDARLEALEPEGLATLIYTSGTTGAPKGVMITHRNLTWTADAARGVVTAIGPDDRSISYLPLSHIAEQMFSIHVPITMGYAVYFAESIEALADNIKEVRPTIFFAVPRVWEKFHAGVSAKLGEASGVKAKIGAWAQRVGGRVTDLRNRGEKPKGLLAFQHRLADRLVFHKVKEALGFDAVVAAVSGAAPIDKEILEFFGRFDLLILEVYGQSEGTGPSTFNRPGRTKFGSVGIPYPGCDVELADDGEVLVRGGNVFAGYYKDAEGTAETLKDGWLHSGDLGEFDDDGFLTITGRKKDIIITAGGKNIAPRTFEEGLKHSPLVSEAVLIGDRRAFLTALVTLDLEAAAAFAEKWGDSGPLHRSEAIREAIQQTVDEVNSRLGRVAQVKKFAILPRELSIDDGELTGTLKVKRDVVADHFADDIESMYRAEG
jgi:long-chain acyl-CoA synthetase